MKKLGWLLMLVAIVIGASQGIVMVRHKVAAFGASAPWRQESKNDEKRLLEAFQQQQGLAQVTVSGRIIKVLPDDNQGSRHQRFIIEVGAGQTLLVAHNIDLAPRLVGLNAGQQVTVSGEYLWNAQGGLLHWTHHDPAGQHPGGWILYNGQRSE